MRGGKLNEGQDGQGSGYRHHGLGHNPGGGIDASTSLISAVRHKEIDGKGVIYPHTRGTLFDVKGWNLKKERSYLEQNLLLINR